MEVDSGTDNLGRKLDLVQAANFFGMELLTFHKKHHLFFSFFAKDVGVEMVFLKKHLLETTSSIGLQPEYNYEVCHPQICCRSGDDICRSASMRQILLEGIQLASSNGTIANDSFLWHWICTSGRRCSLLNTITFEYTLFTLVRDELITFQKNDDGGRDYDIASPKKRKVGRPRKYI